MFARVTPPSPFPLPPVERVTKLKDKDTGCPIKSGMTEGERFSRGFGPARRGSFDFASFGFAPLRSGQALRQAQDRPFDKLRTGPSTSSGQALLFRQKDPKPLAPGRGPRGVPLPRSRLLGLRNSLRSDSPRLHIEFAGPGRSHARRRRGTAKDKNSGCPIKSGMTDKRRTTKTLDPRSSRG